MKELVRQKYARGLYPEHPRALDLDRERGIRNQYPGGGGLVGGVFNVGYTTGLLPGAGFILNTRERSTSTASAASGTSTLAAGDWWARSTTWPTRRPCCRPRCR